MELDAFDLFGKCHRIYVQGVRTAIRERLEAQFGDEWWEQGVLASFRDEWPKQLDDEAKNRGIGDYQSVLENRHFGYIISKHHASVFQNAFPDSQRAFARFRQLTTVRNDWAHVQDISHGRFRQAADLMQDVLAALNRQEALEVRNMKEDTLTGPSIDIAEEPIEEAELESQAAESRTVLSEPVESWRRLQSYLVLGREVEFTGEPDNLVAQVSVRVQNTAPEGPQWPSVVFRNVLLMNSGNTVKQLDELPPGQSAEMQFTVPQLSLLNVELSLSAQIDGDELLRFDRTADLPTTAVGEIRQRFAAEFEEIGIRVLVEEALNVLSTADETLSYGEMAQIRQFAREFPTQANEALERLDTLHRTFRLNRERGLGMRTRELHETVTSFRKAVGEFDLAIGETNPDKLREVLASLKDAQLAVLRVESELRSVGGS